MKNLFICFIVIILTLTSCNNRKQENINNPLFTFDINEQYYPSSDYIYEPGNLYEEGIKDINILLDNFSYTYDRDESKLLYNLSLTVNHNKETYCKAAFGSTIYCINKTGQRVALGSTSPVGTNTQFLLYAI